MSSTVVGLAVFTSLALSSATPPATPPATAAAAAELGHARPRGQPARHWLALVPNADARSADHGRLEHQLASELGELAPTSIGVLRPALDASLRLVHTASTFAAMTGDAEHDMLFGEMPGGALDALGLRRPGPACRRWDTAAWVLSTEHAWGTSAIAVGKDFVGALDGTLFSLERGSDGGRQVRFFLHESLLATALGQLPEDGEPPDLDVDAFVQDDDGNVYLSFRHDELVNGTLLADDGVVCLPAAQLSFDLRGDVYSLTPGCARIVLDRPRVDALVEAADLLSAAGHAIHSLTDLQALALDPAGGRFEPVQAVPGLEAGVPHLLFNGQALGATVLTTRDGGRIATVDGRSLGPRGVGLGLDPLASVGATADLNGLELGCSDRAPPLVMSPKPLLGQDDPLVLCLENFRPGGWAWLVAHISIDPQPGFCEPAVAPGTGSLSAWPWLLVDEPSVAWPVPIDRRGRARIELATDMAGHERLLMTVQAYEVGSGELSLPASVYRP